jgi:hypothetical protein
VNYLFVVSPIILLACNISQGQRRVNESNGSFAYPQAVKKAHVESVYDSTKWYLYAWNCDVLYKPKDDTFVSKPLGELELRADIKETHRTDI